jgi:hypothetical protein
MPESVPELVPDDHWQPTAALVISWTTVLASVLALVLFQSTRQSYHGMEDIGFAVLGILALGAIIVCGAIGTIAAGIGLKRARDREVPVPALSVALVLNLIAFCAPFVMTAGC